MIGKRLGHYQIIETLGEGGMGVVYKARDTQLDRFAAVKVLPPEKLANPDRKLRFIQEAKSASALNHPNIVTIYEIGNEDGIDFIAMELIAGRTLDQLIPRGGLETPALLKYAVPVADALSRAHAAGIVHRDLKPGNIMVGEDGQVKLLDFGLAKLSELPASSDAPGSDPDATRTVRPETEEGAIVGTISYMSPEQAEGRKVDARSDIFSFGAVLYEMATGRRAFQGSSKISILAAILHTEPQPPAALHPGLPRELEKIIQRCLRKDPAWRFQSAADLKISLHDLGRELESGVPAPALVPPPRVTRRSVWPAILAVAIAAASGWWLGTRSQPTPPGPVKPLTTYRGIERDPALSPDGNQIAFSWNGEHEDNYDIYVRLVDGGTALRLTTDPAPDYAPAWSPDSRRIAFIRGNAVYTIPALGGVERKLVQFRKGRIEGPLFSDRVSWSPDGKLLAFTGVELPGPTSVWVVSTEGGEPRRVTPPLPATTGTMAGDSSPAFSPDGGSLAFVRAHDTFSYAVLIQKMAGDSPVGPAREITGYERTIADVTWAADGRSLIASVRLAGWSSLWLLHLNGTLTPLGIGGENAAAPSLSRTGNRLAYESRQTDSNIYRMDGPGPQGGPQPYERCHVAPVVDSTADERDPMLSPDGRRLLFKSDRWGANEIHVADSNGAHQVALTSMGPNNMGSPRWSPDGLTAVFDRFEHGYSSIYAISTEGGKPRRMTGEQTSDIRPSFSRDGRWIYFSSTRSGAEEIWKVPSGGGTDEQMTHGDGGQDVFESHDGKELYYRAVDGLRVMPVTGGPSKLILPEVRFAFALAGRSIYYLGFDPEAIWVYRLDTGRKFEYVRFPPGTPSLSVGGTSMTVSADERVIMYPRQDRQESDLMLVENFK